MRASRASPEIKEEYFLLQRDAKGNKFLTLAEGPTENEAERLKNQVLTGYTENVCQRNEETCPIKLLKLHLEKRPNEMKTSGSFYLSVIYKPVVSSVWNKKTPT